MSIQRDLRTVELVQAFLWTCDDCGRDNFERGITVSSEAIDPDNLPDMPEEQAEMVREWLRGGGEGAWVLAPDRVRCRHCSAEFSTASVD